MKNIFLTYLAIILFSSFGFSQAVWETSSAVSTISSYRGATAEYINGDQQLMYVFGGWTTSSGNFNETSIYNFYDDIWSAGPTIPENTKGGSAVCIDENIYLLIGNDGGDNNINSQIFLKYNVSSETWENLADYPIPARYVAMQYNQNNGLIYCAGGSGDSYAAVDQVYVYDIENDLWLQCTSLPFPNSGGAALLIIGNHLYFIGGLIYEPYDNVFKGLIDIDEPTDIVWTEGAGIPVEMSKISAGYIGNGKIVASELDGTSLYDISTDMWSDIDIKPTPVKGGNYTSLLIDNVYTFAVSGGKDAADNIVDHVEYISGDENISFPATFVLTLETGSPIMNAEVQVGGYSIYTDQVGCAIQFLENGDYDYTAQYENWVASGSFTIDGASVYIENQLLTSINKISDQFSIYPNPGNGIFKLMGAANSMIEVSDIKGNLIYSKSDIGNDFALDITANGPGLYFVKIVQNDGSVSMRKIILE